ncbi:exo-alpha-sialidase [Gardnerella vaginalis]
MVNQYINWKSSSFPNNSGSITFTINTKTDSDLLTCSKIGKEKNTLFTLGIEQGSLILRASTTPMNISLDIEDTYGMLLSGLHKTAITFGDFGTRVYLDGYQVFSCATNLCPATIAGKGEFQFLDNIISDFKIWQEILTPEEIVKSTPVLTPDIEFASASLSQYDIKSLHNLHNGTIFARFRVRGVNQFGTIFATSSSDEENMNIYIGDSGITYKVISGNSSYEYHANGYWNDGGWHDLVVRSFRGAIDIYMDGYLALHQAGQLFFNSLSEISKVSIGEDTRGIRLCGEVRNGGIFEYPLTEGQIKRLSQVTPITNTALFDKGYEGSASYRIPSMITTSNGVVIAGSDQRVVVSNDSPNEIHFIIRRSLDSGKTWLPLQTVIAFPGEGINGPSVIDSCIVYDRIKKRVIVLIDQFPGGRGFANAEQSIGLDKEGHLILHDQNGNLFTLQSDGSVTDSNGQITEFHVDEDGYVKKNGKDAGNIHFKEGIDPNETLLTERTSYLVEVHSDDDGATWTKPRFISHMVKEPWMGFLGTSPGNGIQLSNKKHLGRLLIPYYCCGSNPKFSSGGALISDDGGLTWRRGKAINQGRVVNGQIVDERNLVEDDETTHESTFVERENGDVVVLFRNQHNSGLVGKAISHDGGETWDEMKFEEGIPDIFSQPNAVTLPPIDSKNWESGTASNRVVFANASLMRPYRGCGILRLSEDGCHTWTNHKCFNPYHYVYQCMTVLPDNSLGLLWERETAGVYFAKLPLDWIEN